MADVSSSKAPLDAPAVSGRTRLFLIDDDATSIRFLNLALSRYSYELHSFTSPVSALEQLPKLSPDVVITDLVMPHVDGLAVLRETRRIAPETAVVLLTGQGEVDTAVQAMRDGACDFVTKPVDPDRLYAAVVSAEASRKSLQQARRSAQSISDSMQALQSKLASMNQQAQRALVSALDARERETKQHSVRVSLYAAYLAKLMELPAYRVEEIRMGALLHDIGKIGIPDAVLNKPDRLTEAEWEEMRKHPEIGFSIVRELLGENEGSQLVRCHHERFDGKGYPAGIKGSAIPLGARIFSVVDAYDALTSDRPYRKGVGHFAATSEIVGQSGSQFDPEVVTRFLLVPEYKWQSMAKEAESMMERLDHAVPHAVGS